MSKKILIVESPTKAKAIASYVGKDYKVLSSSGHIRDLSTKGEGGFGLDIKNRFHPTYVVIPSKQKIVNKLIEETKGKEVILASDPDREGEAIAWHLADVLNLDINEKNRVTFTEITKNAVLKELDNLKSIDMMLVDSQEVRRALDRIIGFRLSNVLQRKKIGQAAGRVQSVALKLIVDLEKEIKAFVPEEYYEIKLTADLFTANYKQTKKSLITKEEANTIKKEISFPLKVTDINSKVRTSQSKLAYTTSTLLQDANNYLGFNSANTMRIAQKLFEGIEINGQIIGLITYPRPDSNRLEPSFINHTKKYIEKNYGKNYVGVYRHKDSQSTQGAHEAIRPTDINRRPEDVERFLKPTEFRLYKLIYNTTLESLMAPAQIDVKTITITSNNHDFILEGKKTIFPGYQIVGSADKNVEIPELKIDDLIHKGNIILEQKFTQPKTRYNEASLIKEMESLGIGRPSTYANTMSALKNYGYTNLEKRRFVPTNDGILVSDSLDNFFNTLINTDFTSRMEKQLDEIADGKIEGYSLLESFYPPFEKLVNNALDNMPKAEPKYIGENCPKCNKPLVLKRSQYGEFIGCSGFPDCKFTRYIEKPNTKSFKNYRKKG